MVTEVIWSAQAENDLEEIYLYFEAINLPYAISLVDKIFERIELLRKFPKSGSMVKDINVSFIREIFVNNYKICYSFLKWQH